MAFSSEPKARAFEKYLKSGSGREFARRHLRGKVQGCVTSSKSYSRTVQSLVSLLVLVSALAVSSTALAAPQTTAVWSDGHTAALSDEELVRYATASPGAGYPDEAQKKKLTGSGVYELQVNRSGATAAVAIVKSSGSAVLDRAAKSAFLKWRFKPGVFRSIRVPVSWQVNRVRN